MFTMKKKMKFISDIRHVPVIHRYMYTVHVKVQGNGTTNT